jgi:hypothetical protein
VAQLLDGYPADEPGRQDMLRCIHIRLLCVQEDPQLRPRMASVLLMLDNRIVTMSAPTKPAFVIPGPGERPRAAASEPSTMKLQSPTWSRVDSWMTTSTNVRSFFSSILQ